MTNKKSNQSFLSEIYRDIEYYKKRIASSNNLYEKRHFERLLNNALVRLNYWRNYEQDKLRINEKQLSLTTKELAEFNGANGKPAYVAINGIIYDVSLEASWGGGTHFNLYSGKDLTDQFAKCHGGSQEILDRLPRVGILQD